MRLDKYLKVSRLIKRRTVANEACDAGRVLVNDKIAKASVNVKEGDIIEIKFGTGDIEKGIKSLLKTNKALSETSGVFFRLKRRMCPLENG